MRDKLGIVAIIAFVVVDIVLVTLAVRHVRGAAPVPDAATPSSPSSASPSPDSPAPTPATAAPEPIPDDPMLLALAEDGTVLRAVRGSCADGVAPAVSVSTDGGSSFAPVPVDGSLAEVTGLSASGRRTLRVAGATADCEPVVYGGSAGRDAWQQVAPDDAEMWHLTVGGTEQVHAPGGDVDTPCPVISLTVTGAIRALCESGRIIGTDDDGESWVALGTLEDGVAIGYTGPGVGYALAERRGCPAAVVSTGDGGVSWELETCLGEAPPRAIDAVGDVVVAQVGDQVFRSEDAGDTWTPLG